MKYILRLSLFVFTVSAFAVEVKVRKMTRDRDLDRSFVLTTQLNDKVVLDCQSFIMGLQIGEYESTNHFLLDPDECDSLQARIKTSLRKLQKHCIDVENDIRADYSCN